MSNRSSGNIAADRPPSATAEERFSLAAKPEGKTANDTAQGHPIFCQLSHDIRNQLYIIIGFAELLLDEVPGRLNEEQRRSLRDVLKSGQRLQELLEGVLPSSENGGAVR